MDGQELKSMGSDMGACNEVPLILRETFVFLGGCILSDMVFFFPERQYLTVGQKKRDMVV